MVLVYKIPLTNLSIFRYCSLVVKLMGLVSTVVATKETDVTEIAVKYAEDLPT